MTTVRKRILTAALIAGLATSGALASPITADASPHIQPKILTTSLPDAVQGVAYSFDIDVTGSPDLWFDAGGLPDGLSIDQYSGHISGVSDDPAGTYSVIIVVTNGGASVYTTLSLVEKAYPPVITSGTPPDAIVGRPYSFSVTASGYPQPDYAAAHLPAGLTWNAGLHAIIGIPTTAGSYIIYIVAANGTIKTYTRYTMIVFSH